ncbi:nucleotide exchange factor GrpE [Haloferacaceae archaeon DSL9]
MSEDPATGVETETEQSDDADPEQAEATADEVESEPTAERLASRLAAHDEELAASVRDLGAQIEDKSASLEARNERIEELEAKLRRSKADFQNYKKRTKRKQEQIKERATEDLVERVTTVRDDLVRALDQDEDVDIRPGVESTLETFDRILEAENVSFIEPEPGDEVDPQRHEVMLRVESDRPAGTIVDVYQPGYEMADKVLREAQVTVSDD